MAEGGERGKREGSDGGENRVPKIRKVTGNPRWGGDGEGGNRARDGRGETRAPAMRPRQGGGQGRRIDIRERGRVEKIEYFKAEVPEALTPKFKGERGWERCRGRGEFAEQRSKTRNWEKGWDVPKTWLGDPKEEGREEEERGGRGVRV